MLWECERDAIFFLQNSAILDNFSKTSNVLELGCGSGLLGIFLLQQGFNNLTFQDYNEEVLRFWTVPNILLNTGPSGLRSCSFTNTSWAGFENKNLYRKSEAPNHGKKFDLIFGADILYEVKNYKDLIGLIEQHLSASGMAIISSKAFYYGNGGSVAEFKQFVEHSSLCYERLLNIQNGMSNRREVFCLRFK